jgi:hypothetical protein
MTTIIKVSKPIMWLTPCYVDINICYILFCIFLVDLRSIDELALVYKEAALRTAREEIRANISQILVLLQE